MAKAQKDFRAGLLAAVDKAENEGNLGWRQAKRIRNAADNPRRLRRMEAEALTYLDETSPQTLKFGADGSIDWSKAFAKFLEWLPRIMQLIALFGGGL